MADMKRSGIKTTPQYFSKYINQVTEGSIGSEGEIVMKITAAITLTILAGVMCLGFSFLAPAQNKPAPKTEEKKEKTMFKFRVARPTDNLPKIVQFYRDGL